MSEVNPQLRVQILSISHDLLFVASNGGKRTPKTCITANDNKKFDWFSRTDNNIKLFLVMGCHKQTKVEEEETGMVERQIRRQQSGELIPSNCYHDVFPQFAWDNNDLEECTPSGSWTTHCTNGIVIQKIPDGCENKASDIEILTKLQNVTGRGR